MPTRPEADRPSRLGGMGSPGEAAIPHLFFYFSEGQESPHGWFCPPLCDFFFPKLRKYMNYANFSAEIIATRMVFSQRNFRGLLLDWSYRYPPIGQKRYPLSTWDPISARGRVG